MYFYNLAYFCNFFSGNSIIKIRSVSEGLCFNLSQAPWFKGGY